MTRRSLLTARGAPHRLRTMFSLFTYIALIVGVNYALAVTPLVQLPNGDLWPPASLIVGFVFVVRDFAQRRVGHHILWAMLAGCVVSWHMATPQLAVASAVVSPSANWATGPPFTSRASLFPAHPGFRSLGAPLDSLVFLLFLGLATPWSIGIMSLSKLAGSFLVFFLVRRRERREAGAEAA